MRDSHEGLICTPAQRNLSMCQKVSKLSLVESVLVVSREPGIDLAYSVLCLRVRLRQSKEKSDLTCPSCHVLL